jgi:hypothetical protein
MKKVAIGCAVILVLAGLTAAGLAYYAYRQVRSTVVQFAELQKIPDIESGIRVRDPFVPPASEELTAEQVERLVRVQTLLRDHLGERFAEFEQKYKTLSQKESAALTDFAAIMSAYADLVRTWMDAKRRQVEALNEVGLSLEEYRWIREQSYRALGVPYVDFDIGKLAEDVRSGRTTDEPGRLLGAIGPSGPEANRKLVEPFKKQLEDSVALASFGL